MALRILDRVRHAIRTGNYDVTFHAIEEMAEDNLGILDIENAVLHGKLIKVDKKDPRGNGYILNGLGSDHSTLIGIVGRFKETGVFLIITAYKIN